MPVKPNLISTKTDGSLQNNQKYRNSGIDLGSLRRMEGHLIRTDNGEYLWFNSRTGLYEVVQTDDSREVSEDTSVRDLNNCAVERKNIWNNEQTLLLIDICQKNKERLNNPKYRKTEVYKEISTEMENIGHPFTGEQCLNRMKTLTTKYKEVRDFNATSGNNPKNWVYLDVMTEYFGDRPGIVPRAMCSSLNISGGKNILDDENAPSTSKAPKRTPESDENDKGKKVKQVHARQNPRKEMVTWLKEYKKDVQEREERRLNMTEQQHMENKEMLSQILEIWKNKSTNGVPEPK